MAIFRDGSNDYQRLDYALLQNGSVSLYFRPAVLDEDVEQLKTYGYRIDTFDCAAWQNEEDMFTAFAATLDFPDYFGRNLDALNDCLCDINVPEESGRVLVFHRYDAFAAKMSEVAWIVLDIIESNSRLYLLFGKRLLTLVQSDDPQIQFNGLGAQHANWNRREWLNANRDL
jgi:RNAse (barnase) inhibitor barstar